MGVVSIGVVAMGSQPVHRRDGLVGGWSHTMGVWTAGPMNMGLVRLGGSDKY